MIFASVVLATVLVVSPPDQPAARFDTTLAPQVQSAVVSDPSLQPGFFDPTRFDSATVVSLRAIFDSAKTQGLPERPLINDALHGASVRVSGNKIVNSVRKRFRAMLEARSAMGQQTTESELASGAEAIMIGAESKALQQIRAIRPNRGAALTALVVLADLMQRGIQPNKARDAIVSLARVSSDDALNGLRVLVAKNADRGPGMAQDALDRYVRTNVSGAEKNAPKPPNRTSRPPDAP